MISALILLPILPGALGSNLLNFTTLQQDVICCQDDIAISCSPVSINVDALGEKDLMLPHNITVKFSNMINGSAQGYYYVDENAEAVLTFSNLSNSLYGHVSTFDGRSFVIEDCGSNGHVYKEMNLNLLVDSEAVIEDTSGQTINTSQPVNDENVQTFSVKIYYTPEFKRATPNIDLFIDQMIAETNQGYKNSKVNLRVVKFCPEEAKIRDGNNSLHTFIAFKRMKGTIARLRASADAATLLISRVVDKYCGWGSFDVIASKETTSLLAKPCAVGYYSFGHEIGHNIGLEHNKEREENQKFPYAHGHLIAAGNGKPGMRTIMAYKANGHNKRVNYYSNPNINHPLTKTPLGVEGVSNNAKLLNERAASIANIGNENEECKTEIGNIITCGLNYSLPSMEYYAKIRVILSYEKCIELCGNGAYCDATRKAICLQCAYYY